MSPTSSASPTTMTQGSNLVLSKWGTGYLRKDYSAIESRVKKRLVRTGMDHLMLLASVALAPISLKAPMARPLAIHGTLIT
ncbi:hypothetical protein ACFXTO_032648 [Malus domestica]